MRLTASRTSFAASSMSRPNSNSMTVVLRPRRLTYVLEDPPMIRITRPRLDEDDAEAFARDGVVCLRGLLDDACRLLRVRGP